MLWVNGQLSPRGPAEQGPLPGRVAASSVGEDLAEWTPTHRSGAVAEMVLQRCRRRADFTPAYDGPQAHRTSQAVDRRLNSHDRRLDAMRYGHATTASARLAVRAMALQVNLHA